MADVKTEGALRVELVDQRGDVLATSKPVSGDLPHAEIEWQQAGLDGLQGQTVSLQFRLRRGKLYSYWLQ